MLPSETGRRDGLAYTLWLPDIPRGAIVVLHGAGSAKESHYDYARAAHALGLATVCFDQRGHGESDGPMDARMLGDVVTMAQLLRTTLGDGGVAVGLRGSSMGGYAAIAAALPADAAGVVAICPASAAGLRRGLASGRFPVPADRDGLDMLLSAHELEPAVAALEVPLLLMHAEGDEQVPIQHSRELAAAVHSAGSRLIEVPGGHHRSIQHDPELQAVSLRFLEHVFGLRERRAGPTATAADPSPSFKDP